jgi:hypothetical protein
VEHPKLKSLHSAQLFEALLILTGGGHVHPAQEERANSARTRCLALNRHLCERARSSPDVSFLASPVTGGGVFVPRFHQLFILALHQGKTSELEQATFIWELLTNQGQGIMKEGRTLETPEENIAELTEMARQFAAKRRPRLTGLGVV